MKVDILGAEYTVLRRKESEDKRLEAREGYVSYTTKEIVVAVREYDPLDKLEVEDFYKKVLRHEIVHAFLNESGLQDCAESESVHSELIVDWIAIQFPKILKVFKEVKCL